MKIQKILLATVVGGFLYFLLAWLVWGLLLREVFVFAPAVRSVALREALLPVAAILSCLVWAGFLAFVFSRWAGVRDFVSGAVAGASVAGLVALSVDLGMFSQYSFFTTTQLIVDVIAKAATACIVGGVIGWILGRGEKS